MQKSASERLKRNTTEIMNLWEERAYKEVSAAQHQETLSLRNSLPEYLTQLADALSTTIDRTEARQRQDLIDSTRVGKKHGKERATSLNYTIDQLIFEYHILRQVIFDVMEKEETLSPVEREVIISSIEQAVNDAASEFSDTLKFIQENLFNALAHDLRTPISAAKVSAQLILRRPDDVDNCIQKASRISTSMDRIDDMIKDLLDASRIRAGQEISLDLGETDLDWILRSVVEETSYAHPDRIKYSSKGICLGSWNENALRRVIENLVNNAIKYGSQKTSVSLALNSDKDTAILTVHNQGNPIPKDQLAILFQQYRRAKSTEKKVGWGLGLTVVKGIVNALNGSIRVESDEKSGTTFIISLPKDPRKLSLKGDAD